MACQVLSTAYKACRDKQSLFYAHFLNTEACILGKRGRSSEALVKFRESRTIREKLLPAHHEELANTYNNMGNALMSECEYEEALKLFRAAIEIDKMKPVKERDLILHIRHLNLGEAYGRLQNWEKAIKHVEKGRKFAISNFGQETYYDGM